MSDHWSEAFNRIGFSPDLTNVFYDNLRRFPKNVEGVNASFIQTAIADAAFNSGWSNQKYIRISIEARLRLINPDNGPLR